VEHHLIRAQLEHGYVAHRHRRTDLGMAASGASNLDGVRNLAERRAPVWTLAILLLIGGILAPARNIGAPSVTAGATVYMGFTAGRQGFLYSRYLRDA
jgi:hypothetical protein